MTSPPPSEKSSESDTVLPLPSRINGPGPTPPRTALTSSAPSTKTVPSPSPTSTMTPLDPSTIPIAIPTLVIPDYTNGRAELDMDRVRSLRDSIASIGLLHPITVSDDTEHPMLIAGRHRLEAAKLLDWTHISARLVSADTRKTAAIRLSENVTRTQLSPVEEANQLADLVDADDQGVEPVAAFLGRPVTWILDRLEILSWPESLQTHLHYKRINLTVAKILVRIPDIETRDLRIADAANHGCNARTAQLWLQHAHAGEPYTTEMSEKLGQKLTDPHYQTTTTTSCFVCQQQRNLELTTAVRICHSCVTDLQNPNPRHDAHQR